MNYRNYHMSQNGQNLKLLLLAESQQYLC